MSLSYQLAAQNQSDNYLRELINFIGSKETLSDNQLEWLVESLARLRDYYESKNINIPTTALIEGRQNCLNEHVKGEVEKMGVRYKKNMGKMGEYSLVQQILRDYGKQMISTTEKI